MALEDLRNHTLRVLRRRPCHETCEHRLRIVRQPVAEGRAQGVRKVEDPLHVRLGRAGSHDPGTRPAAEEQVEIRVQSRDEFAEEKARNDAVKAQEAMASEVKAAAPAAQKFEPLVSKEFIKKMNSGRKEKVRGEMDRATALKYALIAAVPVLLCIYFPPWQLLKFVPFEQKLHDKLRSHYVALKEFRTKNNASGWTEYAKKAKPDIDSIVNQLKGSAGAEYPVRQQLLYAARDHWPKMVTDSATKPGPGEESFTTSLSTARKSLRKR